MMDKFRQEQLLYLLVPLDKTKTNVCFLLNCFASLESSIRLAMARHFTSDSVTVIASRQLFLYHGECSVLVLTATRSSRPGGESFSSAMRGKNNGCAAGIARAEFGAPAEFRFVPVAITDGQ